MAAAHLQLPGQQERLIRVPSHVPHHVLMASQRDYRVAERVVHHNLTVCGARVDEPEDKVHEPIDSTHITSHECRIHTAVQWCA